MYTKQLTQPRKIRWRCVKRTTNCKASLTTTLDLFCGIMDSLALLPNEDLPAGLDFLRNNMPEGLDDLLTYFDATYCTGTYRRIQRHADDAVVLRRIPPLFQLAMWNVHQVTLEGEQRTNNFCEAWNHRIEHLCGVNHPSVWKLTHWLKGDSAQVSATLQNNARGEPPRKRVKRVYVQLQARLYQLCLDH